MNDFIFLSYVGRSTGSTSSQKSKGNANRMTILLDCIESCQSSQHFSRCDETQITKF
ncbi:hypothetical protein ACJMK2_033319 [Sinanodonta woodiana]|uniref:Uncharacterized protein n=1 Tax=Sinanodonta woodiana TaxID=1069815 RepID=A0ABD3WPV4_SINWO